MKFFCFIAIKCTQKHITPKSLTSTDLLRTILKSFSRLVRGMEFFSPKYGIRRLKAIVRKWILLDCLLHVANLWNSMFKVPQLPNMTHWAVYHSFVSERETRWMGYSWKNPTPPPPRWKAIFLTPPLPPGISKLLEAPPSLPSRFPSPKTPPPPTHHDFHKIVRYRNYCNLHSM